MADRGAGGTRIQHARRAKRCSSEFSIALRFFNREQQTEMNIELNNELDIELSIDLNVDLTV